MTLEDQLERDLHQIAAGADPSVGAWDTIQARIGTPVEDSQMEVTMLKPAQPRPPRRNWLFAAAAFLVLAVLGAIALVASRPNEQTVLDQPAATTPPSSISEAPTVAASMPITGVAMDAGRYRTSQLAHPPAHPNMMVDFTIDETMTPFAQRTGSILLVVGSSSGEADVPPSDSRVLEISRLGSWSSDIEAVDPAVGVASIPSSELDLWIADNPVVIDNRRTVQVDGVEAQVFDTIVSPTTATAPDVCLASDEPCIWYGSVEGTSSSGTPKTDRVLRPHEMLISASAVHRIWVVPVAGFDPLVIRASAPEGDNEWLDVVESTTVSSIALYRGG